MRRIFRRKGRSLKKKTTAPKERVAVDPGRSNASATSASTSSETGKNDAMTPSASSLSSSSSSSSAAAAVPAVPASATLSTTRTVAVTEGSGDTKQSDARDEGKHWETDSHELVPRKVAQLSRILKSSFEAPKDGIQEALQIIDEHSLTAPAELTCAVCNVCSDFVQRADELPTSLLLGLLDVACHAGSVLTRYDHSASRHFIHHVERLEHEALLVGTAVEQRLVRQAVGNLHSTKTADADSNAPTSKAEEKPQQGTEPHLEPLSQVEEPPRVDDSAAATAAAATAAAEQKRIDVESTAVRMLTMELDAARKQLHLSETRHAVLADEFKTSQRQMEARQQELQTQIEQQRHEVGHSLEAETKELEATHRREIRALKDRLRKEWQAEIAKAVQAERSAQQALATSQLVKCEQKAETRRMRALGEAQVRHNAALEQVRSELEKRLTALEANHLAARQAAASATKEAVAAAAAAATAAAKADSESQSGSSRPETSDAGTQTNVYFSSSLAAQEGLLGDSLPNTLESLAERILAETSESPTSIAADAAPMGSSSTDIRKQSQDQDREPGRAYVLRRGLAASQRARDNKLNDRSQSAPTQFYIDVTAPPRRRRKPRTYVKIAADAAVVAGSSRRKFGGNRNINASRGPLHQRRR